MIIEQKANGSRIEAYQWDGTEVGMSGICQKFKLGVISLDGNKTFKISKKGKVIGDVVAQEWVTKDLESREIKIMSHKEFEELFRG